MRVILEQSIFSDPLLNPLKLYSLLDLSIKGRHLIQTDPLESTEMLDWLEKQGEHREWCEWALTTRGFREDANENPNAPPFTIRVGNVNQSLWNQATPLLSLEDASQFLTQPMIIFLENRRNDRAFLETVAILVTVGTNEVGELVSGRDELKRLSKKSWINFETGGGIGEVLKYVKEELYDKPERYLRCFILVDSDALSPGKPGGDSKKVVKACHEIPRFDHHYHQLNRRAIENYLPIEALEKWVEEVQIGEKESQKNRQRKETEKQERQLKVMAFRELNPLQRHHFNMKEGFNGDRKRSSEVGNLYDDLDALTKQHLTSGFGENIAKLFKQEPPQIRARWLLQDNQLSEIEPLVLKILALV
jgi:hypothetical protein